MQHGGLCALCQRWGGAEAVLGARRHPARRSGKALATKHALRLLACKEQQSFGQAVQQVGNRPVRLIVVQGRRQHKKHGL